MRALRAWYPRRGGDVTYDTYPLEMQGGPT
jgi:hypothetical protein